MLPRPAEPDAASTACVPSWHRRARPQLGTLVEVAADAAAPPQALDDAFAAIARVQSALSRFEPGSDVARFNALPAGGRLKLQPAGARVLRAAQALHTATAGCFDVALGSGRWRCEPGGWLVKLDAATRLDLGGVAKGYAVDQAVAALRRAGARAGWVNAGGDLRTFGNVELPLRLRDERHGGVRELGFLHEGAFATSHYGPGSRCALHGARENGGFCHVSVAAPRALWADALTKLVALDIDVAPLLQRLGAQAWVHPSPTKTHRRDRASSARTARAA
jgi:thiamine biosynthesis lipoprotein